MARSTNIVHAVVTIQGGQVISRDDEQRIEDHVNDTLAQDDSLGKKYGRDGYSTRGKE